MEKAKKPFVLVVLDGFGLSSKRKGNAVALAHKPHFNYFSAHYPHTALRASGTAVGLLKGCIGNSEVGHLTLGCGRIIPQALSVIHDAIVSGSLAKNRILKAALQKLKKNNGRLHIMGLLSDAGVHSHVEFLYALIKIAAAEKIKHIYIHPFLDGRDVSPGSAAKYLRQLEKIIKTYPHVRIGSLHGRYYAMDRNNNVDRTRKSFNVLTEKTSPVVPHWQDVLAAWKGAHLSEEFLPPVCLDPESIIRPQDGVIFFNFRPDRARQLTHMLLQAQGAPKLSFFITPYAYGPLLKTAVLFKNKRIKHTFSDILHAHKKSFFAIAESEKYAHVTYFFNAGREKLYTNETRIIVPSLKSRTYIKHPRMSAPAITAQVLKSLRTDPKDFYLINYANADMVGHSGNLAATIKAVECIDYQLGRLYNEVVMKRDGTLIITADHGNAEQKIEPKTGGPSTSHTANRVPFIYICKKFYNKKVRFSFHGLAGVAPFLLKNMGLPIPAEMSVKSTTQIK